MNGKCRCNKNGDRWLVISNRFSKRRWILVFCLLISAFISCTGKKKDAASHTPVELSDEAVQPANTVIMTSIKTTRPVFKKMRVTAKADGYIDYDERMKSSV